MLHQRATGERWLNAVQQYLLFRPRGFRLRRIGSRPVVVFPNRASINSEQLFDHHSSSYESQMVLVVGRKYSYVNEAYTSSVPWHTGRSP